MQALPPPPPPIITTCPAEARGLQRAAQCGYVRVPLDRANPDGRSIRVYFERYRRTNRDLPRISTVVSLEGGPGYAVTPGRSSRVDLWRPVSARRDLVLFDLRGTGGSAPLGCEAFSRPARHYVTRAGRCAKQIGPKRDLYSTSQAVQDLEAVLRSLHAGKIDLYGDSYGTYAAQAYALRFPQRLRSLTLDAAYPLPGTDPAWADLVEAIRIGLDLSCSRSVTCPTRNPVLLVERFANRVRAEPILGTAPDGDGKRTDVRLDEDAFVQLVSASYWYPGLWRDLPAAILAANNGRPAAILRLAAETVTVVAPPDDPPTWSEGLYLAVICHDYPQLWDPSTPIAARRAEAEASIAAYPPGTFLPFSAEAWTHTDYEGVLACLRWPLETGRPARSARPARRRVSGCPDARAERRPRHDHGHVRGAGGGAALPRLDVRRRRELGARDRARRLGSLRLADLRKLRPEPRLQATRPAPMRSASGI